MEVKKKYIIIPIITIIGILSIISLFKILSYRLTILRVEKELLSYYNLNQVDSIKDNSIELEFCLKEPPSEYNITKLVNYYLSQLYDVKNKIKIDKDTYSYKHLWVQDDKYYYEQFADNYAWYIQDENIDIDYAISELEKIFIHKNDEWFISVDTNEKCDLPYGYYFIYDKRKFKKLDNVKKVTNVKLIDKLDFDNQKFKETPFHIEVTYIDKKDVEQKQKRFVTYDQDTKLWSVGLNHFYFDDDSEAKIRLCHHAYDKEREEVEKRIEKEMEEMQRQKLEYEENLSIEERYFNPVFG